jgi:hypothetical protein
MPNPISYMFHEKNTLSTARTSIATTDLWVTNYPTQVKSGRVNTLLICVAVCLYVSAIVIQLPQLEIWQVTLRRYCSLFDAGHTELRKCLCNYLSQHAKSGLTGLARHRAPSSGTPHANWNHSVAYRGWPRGHGPLEQQLHTSKLTSGTTGRQKNRSNIHAENAQQYCKRSELIPLVNSCLAQLSERFQGGSAVVSKFSLLLPSYCCNATISGSESIH